MRLIDVVLAGVLLGLIVGFLQMTQPATANTSGAREARNVDNERLTWLKTPPLMRRTSFVQ
jgi:hypothetical protein